jgi:hypothetical protein
MNALSSSTLDPAPLVTEKLAFQGLPPDPKDPVKSSKNSSHELIIDGADTTTTGCTGATGARTDTICIEDLSHVAQYSVAAAHLAPRIFAFSFMAEF